MIRLGFTVCCVCVYNKQLINCVKTFPIRLGSAISGATFCPFFLLRTTRTGENKMRSSHNYCSAVQCSAVPLIVNLSLLAYRYHRLQMGDWKVLTKNLYFTFLFKLFVKFLALSF